MRVKDALNVDEDVMALVGIHDAQAAQKEPFRMSLVFRCAKIVPMDASLVPKVQRNVLHVQMAKSHQSTKTVVLFVRQIQLRLMESIVQHALRVSFHQMGLSALQKMKMKMMGLLRDWSWNI